MTPQLGQQNALNEPFSEVGYKQLIGGLVEHEFYDEAKQISYDSDVIKSVENIGTFQGNRFHNILIINHTAGIGARVKLATQTFKLMAASNIDAALVAYYSDEDKLWRISLVTLSLEESNTGRVTKIFSNPRRYSYVLGSTAKTVTPYKFLISKGVTTDFNDLLSRFSVEVVNNEFYREIAKLYDELAGSETRSPGIKYPEEGEASHQFAVRLIGRVVFCWFLREKHSSQGIPLISRNILSRESASKGNYYNETLAPLFFETLNKPIPSRAERFQVDDFGKVPYLNGGLFAPQKDDYYKYDNHLARSILEEVEIPDDWLCKLLDLLELYHFTVDENTSIDIDLSIDPEMLGRIFENLLARINPETGETVRNATGSFYTPREIVEYMVDESLLQYLTDATHINKESLRALISYDLTDDKEHPLKDLEKTQVVKAIGNLKMLDPACGSGAFPIGMLQKIVFILQRIDPEARLWFENQIVNTSPEVRRLIEREFENQNFDYIRKLGVIRESIFGVDIQPIATEIARLRCFLTLIVDERVLDDEQNRGVYPLPNLDFKFVTANTLIKLNLPQTKGVDQVNMFEDRSGIDELKVLRGEYFNSHDGERDSLKLQFSQAQNRMLQNMISHHSHGFSDITHKLSVWDPFNNKSSSWFDPEWVFGIEGGFDIVIANPPYIDSESMSRNDSQGRELLTKTYSTAKGNWDIFVVFTELGMQLLKPGGTISYIVPNKLVGAKYTEELRRYMQTKEIISVRNYSRYKVFKEADIYPIVFVCSNQTKSNQPVTFATMSSETITEEVLSNSIPRDIFNRDIYWDKYFISPRLLELLLKIGNNKILENYCSNILGSATVSEAYEIKKYLVNFDSLDSEADKYKKFVNTGTIDPYQDSWANSPTQYIKDKYTMPVILDKDIESVSSTRLMQANSEKLIIAGMSKSPECIYDDGQLIAGKSTSIILVKDIKDIQPQLLQAFINSNVVAFWFISYFKSLAMAGGYINVNQNELKKIPIPITPPEVADEIVGLVELLNTSNSLDRESTLRDINALIYRLYKLSSEDILVIEEEIR